jgi:hypothetical protein
VPYKPHAWPFKLKLVGNPNESSFDKTKTDEANYIA